MRLSWAFAMSLGVPSQARTRVETLVRLQTYRALKILGQTHSSETNHAFGNR